MGYLSVEIRSKLTQHTLDAEERVLIRLRGINEQIQQIYYPQNAENKNADDASGAGTACAQLVLEKEVNAVITGQVGPNAFEVLKQGGGKIFLGPDDMGVRDALARYQNGELRQMEMKVF